MSNPADYDYNTGYGGGVHPLEQDGVGGHATFELGIIVAFFAFFVRAAQAITILMTVLGTLLAATDMLSVERYGPIFSQPVPLVLAGMTAWTLLRLFLMGVTRLFGGGAVSRYDLYNRPGRS